MTADDARKARDPLQLAYDRARDAASWLRISHSRLWNALDAAKNEITEENLAVVEREIATYREQRAQNAEAQAALEAARTS